MKQILIALAGATVGGVVGYLVFFWMVKQGFYGLVLPGGLLGLGAGIVKNRSIALAIICGLAALCLGICAEWRSAPFVADESLGYFLTHIFQLNPVTLVMILVGGLLGFWIPFRRKESLRSP
jgi:hypothetical protein